MRCALLALLLATSSAGAADLRSARTSFDDGRWDREVGQLGKRTTTPAIRYTRGDLAAGTQVLLGAVCELAGVRA